jgi:hypothetical protein
MDLANVVVGLIGGLGAVATLGGIVIVARRAV